jgi:hypothetical protein
MPTGHRWVPRDLSTSVAADASTASRMQVARRWRAADPSPSGAVAAPGVTRPTRATAREAIV